MKEAEHWNQQFWEQPYSDPKIKRDAIARYLKFCKKLSDAYRFKIFLNPLFSGLYFRASEVLPEKIFGLDYYLREPPESFYILSLFSFRGDPSKNWEYQNYLDFLEVEKTLCDDGSFYFQHSVYKLVNENPAGYPVLLRIYFEKVSDEFLKTLSASQAFEFLISKQRLGGTA